MLNAGQVLENRYRILKSIGKGGMSTVYQAEHIEEGKLLAIKVVLRTGDEPHELVEKALVSESNMLKQLSNSHLPKIYDFIIYPDRYMLVMDYVHGESLDRVLLREGAQPMNRVLEWGMQICEAFAYLHSRPTPIIYRDMKPANLIVQPNGHLMMIDFGTARTQKQNVQMAADTICFGTAGFAAPEQFGGIGQSTPRTDVFCLGGTLYNMITGHSPCDRPQGILPLERWNPALKDTPLSAIIAKCTRNDPDERYQTAMELYEDLRKARDGVFVAAESRMPNLWQRQNMKPAGVVGSGLSGLLKMGKTAAFKQAAQEQGLETPKSQDGNSRGGAAFIQQNYPPAQVRSALNDNAVPAQNANQWRRLTLISLIIAAVMALFGIVLLVTEQTLAGLLCVIVAMGAALLALAGAVFSSRKG